MLVHFDGVELDQLTSEAERAAAIDAIRGRALAIATGLAALLAVYYTARNADTARRTYEVGQQSLRLSEQLGSKELAVRLGGIYAADTIGLQTESH
ncbi:hypothetical protein ACWDA3_38345 [Nonomuraea rubra]